MAKITFGEIEGFPEGYHFKDRKSMMEQAFHRKWGAGIDGNAKEGTAAIVLSGGYEDDEDLGNIITYTGAGGNKDGKQIEDQSWDNLGNAGLKLSMNNGLPVRVIRGHNHKSKFSPKTGYTYAGLYSVTDAWDDIGKSGYKICKFKLTYSGSQHSRLQHTEQEILNEGTSRKEQTLLRIIRDSTIATDVKKMYEFKCQVCEFTIKTDNGNYAEGAHIKPLGTPHNGNDRKENILCLCPNHHVMFDKGLFSISDNYKIIGTIEGELFVIPEHKISSEDLKHHRNRYGYESPPYL